MFTDIAFIIIWIGLQVLWYYMLKAGGLNLLRLSIPTIVIIFFYVFQYLGLPLLYFKLDKFRVFDVTNQELILRVFLYTSVTITLMIVGFVFARFRLGKLYWEGLQNKSVSTINSSNSKQTFGVLTLVLICVTVLIFYSLKVGFRRIALFVALGLGEDGLSVAAARSLMTNAFPGKHHWYHLFKYALLSFGVFVLFAQYLLKRTIINKVILISATIPLMFSLLMTVEKGPIINFLIAIFFIYVFVKKEGWITKRVLTVFSIVLLAIALLIYIFTVEFIENRSILIRVAGFFSRLFTGQIEPVYHYLEYFPTVRNFLLGRSFPNFGVLPFDQINLTTELMAWLKPGELSKGVVGSMPTIYWGEMYANFGALGAFIPPLFIGYGLYALNVIVFRLRSSALSIALFVWLMMHFKDLSGTSLSNFILDIYALSIFIVFIILIAFVNSGKIRLVRNIKTN